VILSLRTDETFRALGTDVRLVVAAPDAPALAAAARDLIERFEACCSRFRPESELCALNADPRPVVPASRLLRDAVRAALWAAERSGGLVDPCLLGALERAGYRRSFAPAATAVPPPSGPARAAAPDPAARWRAVAVDDERGTIARPPGLRLDLGGSGKGHVADRVAALLAPARSWVVDCGGDVRLGGTHEVHVQHPLGGAPAARLTLTDTAVATSSVVRRAWRTRSGAAHHLLDPATGRPAWAGLLSATAFAPSALEAETLAKVALLQGTDAALVHGGLLVRAGGEVAA
jgi:thiamine biosynthesis lipoprotein